MNHEDTVTSPKDVIEKSIRYKQIIKEIENQLGAHHPHIEERDGYGPHISIDIEIPNYMRHFIEKAYGDVGWQVVFKNHDNVMFILPTSKSD